MFQTQQMNVYMLWTGEDGVFALNLQDLPETMQAGASNNDSIFGRYPA
jgi:N-acetyl-beta-hexosaminidase